MPLLTPSLSAFSKNDSVAKRGPWVDPNPVRCDADGNYRRGRGASRAYRIGAVGVPGFSGVAGTTITSALVVICSKPAPSI